MEFQIWQIVALVGTGLFAGVLGGLLGVGGSIIMIPGMQIILGPNQHLYQASAMMVNVAVAVPSARRHYRSGVVLGPIVRWLIPAAIVGVVVGVFVSNIEAFAGRYSVRLGKIFAIFLAYVVVYNVWRVAQHKKVMPAMDNEAARRVPPALTALVGAGMGFVAGLLGIGGGALAVPAQQIFLRLPLKNAIGNSALTMVFSAIIGAIYKNATLGSHHYQFSQSVLIAAMLIPSAFIGGGIGARLTHALPRLPVRIAFMLLMVAAAWKMWNIKPRSAPRPDESRPPATAPADPAPSTAVDT